MDNQIFEDWWKNNINVTEIPLFKNQYPDGTWRYTDHKTDLAWEVWKAATKRAADMIENEVCADIAELRTINSNLIEQVVTLLKDTAWSDGIIDMRVSDLIEDVRALKGKLCLFTT